MLHFARHLSVVAYFGEKKVKFSHKVDISQNLKFYLSVLIKNGCKRIHLLCRRWGFSPGLGRSPREGNINPFQYSSLENPKNRGVWQATVCRITKSWTWLTTEHMCVLIKSPIFPCANKREIILNTDVSIIYGVIMSITFYSYILLFQKIQNKSWFRASLPVEISEQIWSK